MPPDPEHGGHPMAGPLARVLVCEPEAAGWSSPGEAARWRELGYHHEPDATTARAEHRELTRQLAAAGVRVVTLPPGASLSMDALYPRDATLLTDFGAVALSMGKEARGGEPAHHSAFLASFGVPVLGRIEAPATLEGGDVAWLDGETLLVGRSYRTNRQGIEQLRDLLAPRGVQVIEAPLPHGRGPGVCTHLGSLLSILAPGTALVDLPRLAVETVEELGRRSFHLVEVDPAERSTHGCNVLTLGAGRVLALEENPRTNHRLAAAGFEVLTFPGGEICQNGGGGPTCLTLPLLQRS